VIGVVLFFQELTEDLQYSKLAIPINLRARLSKIIKATLGENITYIRKTAEKSNIQSSLLLYIVGVLIQPGLEEIARKIDSSTLDKRAHQFFFFTD